MSVVMYFARTFYFTACQMAYWEVQEKRTSSTSKPVDN